MGGTGSEGRTVEVERRELVEEASALAMYVARRGTGVDAKRTAYQELLEALEELEGGEEVSARDARRLREAYGRLAALTYTSWQVNGRTVLDTERGRTFWSRVRRYRPLWLGVTLFFSALFLESEIGSELVASVRPLLLSAVWGGLGSCVFLAKRISDKLAAMAYEDARMRGDGIRVFLGAMLGVVAVGLLFPDFDAGNAAVRERLNGFEQELQNVAQEVADLVASDETDPTALPVGDETDVPFGVAPATLAFLAGLGVKPVYAAFESLSEALAARFKAASKDPPSQ